MNKTPKSPWKPQETILAGQAASRAGRRHSNTLKKRLGENFFDELDGEIAKLQQLDTGRTGPKEAMKGKTRELRLVVAEAHTFLIAARSAIKAHYPVRHPMRTHFGLGITVDSKSMKATLDALQMFVQAMEQFPNEASAASLGADDLAKLRAYLTEIPVADSSQEDSKDQRKSATALLESTNYGVYTRLNRLKIAAALDLAHDPKAINEIVGPLPVGRSKKKGEPVEE